MPLTINKNNIGKCTRYKKSITKKMITLLSQLKGTPDAYYQVMGYGIQQLHESKKIDFMCRSFLMHNLRKTFIDNNKYKLPSETELSLYSHYSEYAKSIISADFTAGRIIEIEGISYNELDNFASKMDDSSTLQKQNSDNIQKALHHIWLTTTSTPRELIKSDIENVIYNKEFFAQNDKAWSHIVWTNDKTLIPKSINSLESNGIKIRSIYDYKDELKLFDQIIELTENGKYGMASDILRLSIIANEGGVYADLNFRFKQNIIPYLQKYDFFCGDFRNNFFAAKANHIIIEKSLEKIQENLANPPSYINNLSIKTTIQVTHLPFVLSIIDFTNEGSNVDFYNDYYYAYGLTEFDQGPVGVDNFGTSGTWKDEL